jgi:quinol monooxygenase YgiN
MSPNAVHIIVSVSIAAPVAEEALEIGQTLATKSREEAGNIYYDFVKAKDTDGTVTTTYYIIEKYVDQAAVELHFKTEHFLTLVPQLVEKGMTIKFLKQADDLCTGERSLPPTATDSFAKALRLIVSVHVSSEEEFVSIAQRLAEKSREEAGCLDYTFAKVKESADCEYFFIELWTTLAALQAHAETSHYMELVPLMENCLTQNDVMMAYVGV